ncbi:MAG: response regulator [Deltaproteobacteria bacterium]|nr:response regulator [Deltaproteobacteria bacterium]
MLGSKGPRSAAEGCPKVLVVDDDPSVRRALALELRGDFEVLLAGERAAASALLALHRDVMVLVCDLELGFGGDGLEILTEARATRPHCLRVLVSGSTAEHEVWQLVQQGEVDVFVPKPWHPGELVRAIQRLAWARAAAEEVA